jgi:hypothetical protein
MFRAHDIVHSRFFPYEALTIISCNGCVAEVRDNETNETYPVAVGCITRAKKEDAE